MKELKYKILSHTADLRLEVYGKNLEELFENGAEAIADILASGVKRQVSGKFKEIIKIKSANLNALLVDFLNEILAKSHINKQIFKVKSLKLKGNSVAAELESYLVKEFDEDIKAVTYHEVDIKQIANRKALSGKLWHTKLVLDI